MAEIATNIFWVFSCLYGQPSGPTSLIIFDLNLSISHVTNWLFMLKDGWQLAMRQSMDQNLEPSTSFIFRKEDLVVKKKDLVVALPISLLQFQQFGCVEGQPGLKIATYIWSHVPTLDRL